MCKYKLTAKIMIIIISSVLLLTSCTSNNNDSGNDSDGDILSGILKNSRDNGMTSWWEIVAVYNAGENAMDYKGYNEILQSLEGTQNIDMAKYIIVTDISVAIGADIGYFEKFDEYTNKLKDLLENPVDSNTLNDYIFGYYALRCSGISFDPSEFYNYLESVQKSDGGFALSGDKSDVDMTAFAIQALNLYYKANPPGDGVEWDKSIMINAVNFLESRINDDGTFSSYDSGNPNANSTAAALSALICYYGEDISNETIKKISDGLNIFKIKNEAGYSYLKDEKSNELATYQAAIALGDLNNKKSVWETLYNESLTAFATN